MRLKCIKLAGFKSFVDPTTVNLPGNLCAVVGPNGCGKSNIIDAVRWVMGEISAKHLRGESMADVIFSGSGTRKPVAQATIELIFDNSAGTLGGEYAAYAEISVKRRVSRDGQSAYFLNGSRCRRRDVTDVFLGTGLGPRSYAIIEQGMISGLIESRPEDLRVYIEEAAGISKYKERRKDTETRIRHTRENLERLTDIRDEMGRQLDRLERQAAAAEKYRVLKAEERQLNAQHLALNWRDYDADARGREAVIAEQATALEALIAERHGAEAALERLRADHVGANEVLNSAQQQFYAIGAEVSAVEQKIQHGKEQIRRLRADLEQVERNLVESRQHLENDTLRNTAWTAELAEVTPAREAAQRQSAAAAELQEDERLLHDVQQRWEVAQRESAEAQRRMDQTQARIQHLDSATTRTADRLRRLRAELAEVNAALPSADLEALGRQLAEQERANAVQQEERAQISSAIAATRAQQVEIATALNAERKQLQELQGRRAGLVTLLDAARAKGEGAGAWLKARGLEKLPRLADGLDVEPGWELAVETVLGTDLQALCAGAIEPLRDEFASFARGHLSLVEAGAVQAAAPAGELPRLVDKLRDARPLAEPLLANIYAADDFESGWAQRAGLRAGESIISRDGIWFGANWLRLIRGDDLAGGVLIRKRELAAVEQQMLAADARIAAAAAQHGAAETAMRDLEARRGATEQQLARAQREYADLRARQSAEQARSKQLDERNQRVLRELGETEALLAKEVAEVGDARRDLQGLLDQMQAANSAVEAIAAERNRRREAAAVVRSAAQHQRDALHQLDLRERSLTAQLGSVREGLERIRAQVERLTERRDGLALELAGSEDPAALLQQQLQDRLAARLAAETALATARAAVERLDAALRTEEARRVTAERQVQAQRERLEQLRLAGREVRIRADGIAEQLQSQGFTVAALLADLPDGAAAPNWQELLDALDRRIQRLGPINLAAVDEFRQQSERKVYLDAQDAELRDALETLESAIRKIDRETRARFRETFDKINSSLQELFPKLFGGGQAGLELTGDDLLDTGVTIMAQPPGKRNATIHLLSGGEKALTAIALVFSIFQLNPAPFCMLDEVDAPLDDINAERYARLVREMSEKVQFIYITHNKISMEIAGQLLGVTMHEPGVSRLVAVDVDEAVRLAEAG
ncbi:MAG: chromosome segregation protein SMC [Gammaproteobacteria bacterium]|nr:chromosome segregation protein SMC [Gammaproteobacteria bacterium]